MSDAQPADDLLRSLARRLTWRRARRLPGFGVSLGITLSVLTLLVVIPIGALLLTASRATAEEFIDAIVDPRTLAAYELSVGASAIAAFVESLVATGQAARLDKDGKLPAGATHKIVEDEAGNVTVVRRRFSVT